MYSNLKEGRYGIVGKYGPPRGCLVSSALLSWVINGVSKVGETQVYKLELLNSSGDTVRMHIIPPTTPYFGIRYTN